VLIKENRLQKRMNFKLQWYERLPSTNVFLKERLVLEPELESGTVIVAREQTAGKGRRDREWISSANENLTFSLLYKPDSIPWSIPSVSMAVAIAVAELLSLEGIEADLKWPNDVLVRGKKICGILSEGASEGIIIGIGLNVNMDETEQIDQPATSMLIETGERRDVDALLKKLLIHLEIWLTQWQQGGFPQVRKVWEANVPNLGKMVSVRDGDSQRQGILFGFGDSGELLLEEEGGVSAIWAGDVSTS